MNTVVIGRRARRFVAALAAGMLLASGVAQAQTVAFLPHRAIYSIKLGQARAGSGVSAVQGAMVFEMAESCDRWTVLQKAKFELVGPDGNGVETEVNFTSWEAKAEDEFGFSLKTVRDGEVAEDLRGTAGLEGPGGAGTGTYVRPEARTVALPKGTLFPTAHTRALIEAGQSGRQTLSVPVFLGQRDDEPMLVSAAIRLREPTTADPADTLRAGKPWRVELAFFGPDDDSTPAFEMAETLYDSGLVSDVVLTYDDFSMIYTIEKVEPLPRPRC